MIQQRTNVPRVSERASILCPLCNGETEPWRYRRGFDILRCKRCDNGFVPQYLVPTNADDIYSAGYFQGEAETGYPGYVADQKLIERNFADRIAWISSFSPKGRLLEIGSAYGYFLKVARERGWDAVGVELIEPCALEGARLSGATVYAGDFLELDIPGHFDVVAMFDVIEHMKNPLSCIEKAHGLLTPEGVLVIETGDHGMPWARLLRNYWYFLDPPQHRFYFSRAGIEHVLKQAGFVEDIHVRRVGRRVSVSNIAFKLSAAFPKGRVRTAVANQSKKQLPGSLYLNFGDGMLVAARKSATEDRLNDKPSLWISDSEITRPAEIPSIVNVQVSKYPCERLPSINDFEIQELQLEGNNPILTIDVEEWYHANFQSIGDYHDEALPSRVEEGVDRLLEILDQKSGQATFFILGSVAQRHSKMVKRIADSGHEIACHGWSHQLIYQQSQKHFEQDIIRTRSLLRELSGQPVLGFRAPSWSITEKCLWAFDIIAEAGFKYDSSVFPAATYLYGIDKAPIDPCRLRTPSGNQLIEVPPSVFELTGYRLGVGGGFYLRVLPVFIQQMAMRSSAARGAPFVFYAHPREFDPDSWNLRLPLSIKEQFIHRFGISRSEKKLEKLLRNAPRSMRDVLGEHLNG
jgi:polysaccharide deacetylase family protein (PEP-CTERM system associated)